MTQREKFFETVGILVEAYLNDTLTHGECQACAVGNIIAKKLNCTVVPSYPFWRRADSDVTALWGLVFITNSDGSQTLNPRAYMGSAKKQIDATGYSWQQLALIESSFERAAHYDGAGKLLNDIEEAMFNGLMNVVDALAAIHSIDLSERESAKLLFKKESV